MAGKTLKNPIVAFVKPIPGSSARGHRFSYLYFLDHRRQYCCYCGAQLNSASRPLPSNVEHLVPRSRRGSNRPENKQPCCVRCNLERANKSYEKWHAELSAQFATTKDPVLRYELEHKLENIAYWNHFVQVSGKRLRRTRTYFR
ncbi:HNH endonuclease [Flaviaesturariibacter flavus]|uniref:HNH endonuclease n=1 Tax=Flaviaesturariibacter flavus TaxID=2502780 RepID=UPI003742E7AB